MLYEIEMKTKYGDGYLSIKSDRSNNYEIDPEYPNLYKAIGRTDVLRNLNGHFLFSKKLKEILSHNSAFEFSSVNIFYKEELISDDYYLVKILNKIELIDYENSTINGNPFFDTVVFKLNNIASNDLVVMDKDNECYIYYTDKFHDLVISNNIDIDLIEVL
ncbi:imm11 family protein [Glaesserella sp.]|uniref:imm11 family protein n=1 Tax=Glaesserella sp. TaxID=2094731 RepID=UPI00359FDB54